MARNTPEYNRKYREKNKEKVKEDDSLRYYANPEPKKQATKDRYAANPEAKNEYDKAYNQTPQGKKKNRKSKWKKRGVIFETKEEFEAVYKIYLETEFCNFCNCKLHEGNVGSGKKTLDHDHTTGKFRNILCNKCNITRK
jgi:hypothetical protein